MDMAQAAQDEAQFTLVLDMAISSIKDVAAFRREVAIDIAGAARIDLTRVRGN